MNYGKIALIGATGRLGSAIAQRYGCDRLVGLARHPPEHTAQWQGFVAADRQDQRALAAVLRDADAVIDLCGFTATDATALVRAAHSCGRTDLRLVAASSVAERPVTSWNQPEQAMSPLPEDAYGLAKREYTEVLLEQWPGPTLCLLLSNLIQMEPPDPRLARWWQEAQSTAIATIPGSGNQQVALLPSDLAAELVLDLLPLLAITGRLALACPRPPSVATLAAALFSAMTPAPQFSLGGQPGCFSAGNELVDTGALQAALPAFAWPDLQVTFRALGDRLARDRLGS